MQQNGAFPHYARNVQTLNQMFSNRWIGKGGPISWPPKSPDLTSLDFFLGLLKKYRVSRAIYS